VSASELPDLARTLEYLSGYEDQTQPVEVPPSVLADAARLLRAIAEDFSFHAGHNPACDSLHWEKRECDCEVSKKLARWRLK
jgi:hypothetical protein